MARPAEDAGYGAIAFVARVLVQVVAHVAPQRQLQGPRLRVDVGILDPHLPVEDVLGHPGEALHQPQLGADRDPVHPSRVLVRGDPRLLGKVPGLDDQRLPFPPPAGVPHPLRDLRVDEGPAVERNDPRLAHHLVQDDDIAGNLEDVIAGVVGVGEHRAGHAAGDAAAVRTHVLVRIRAIGHEPCGPRLGFRPRRHPPGRRVGDHRRAARVDDRIAGIAPEPVVADVKAPAHGGPCGARRTVCLAHLPAAGLDLGGLLLGVELLIAEPRRPLERRQRVVPPDAGDVRLSVDGARCTIGGIGRDARLPRGVLCHRHRQECRCRRGRNPLVHRFSVSISAGRKAGCPPGAVGILNPPGCRGGRSASGTRPRGRVRHGRPDRTRPYGA